MTTQQTEGYHLPEELRMVQRTVADFRDNEILPLELQLNSEAAALPEEDYKQLSETTQQMGLWCADAPESAGGGGLSYFGAAVMREEMSQHRAGFFVPCYETFGVTPPFYHL